MNSESHRLYSTWKSMRTRCTNSNTHNYKYYGGRGIKVFREWEDFWVFVKDMYPSHKEGLTLDRIDNDGNYCKENCRWATKSEQNNNQTKSLEIFYEGEFYTEAELAALTGVIRTTIQSRRKRGFTPEEMVNGKDTRKYKVGQLKFNLKELAEFLGISPQLLCLRFKRGFSLEELVNEFKGV